MTQQDADALARVLHDHFAAHVDLEEVAHGRFRYTLVSPQFTNMAHLERQDRVWEVIDQNVTRDQTLDISLVLTLAPDDCEIAPTL